MKPYLHGLISVKKFGGKAEDYQKIHDWFDQSKAHFPDMRHRAILHSSFGIYLAEQFFGTNITNSDGKKVSVRDIGEQHVLDDLGTIPTVQDYLKDMPFYSWLGGKKRDKEKKTFNLADLVPPVKELLEEIRKPVSPSEMVFDGSRPSLLSSKNPTPHAGDGRLTQAEIDALLMGTEPDEEETESSDILSQAEIDQLLSCIVRGQPWNDNAEQLEFDFHEDDQMGELTPIMAPDSIEDTMMDGMQPQFDDMGDFESRLAD